MKRVVLSSNNYEGWYGSQFIGYRGKRFSIHDNYSDDPSYYLGDYQCTVSEIHPYDLAEYAWAKKDRPNAAAIIKDGKRIKYIDIPEYDEDMYEYDFEYLQEVTETIFDALIKENKDVEPRIDHT